MQELLLLLRGMTQLPLEADASDAGLTVQCCLACVRTMRQGYTTASQCAKCTNIMVKVLRPNSWVVHSAWINQMQGCLHLRDCRGDSAHLQA